ncbi:autotransporter outer membrane beta-barrel domain-containing protein [Parendozoicomonas sp. Alg238-R29]|uniref:autotransporter family protein n=1 Tax=Parendozoicomonas sp. Alg238-R29 TaxID=2993446 RepID=UPI00248EEA0E|nr:autotransporter outer membrane beta-barrel domain-containing protein [Parendozoicomonas sp. Alg238-R29]
MPRSIHFSKTAIAIAVSSAAGLLSSTIHAAPLVINKTGLVNSETRVGASGNSAAISLERKTNILSSSRCNQQSHTCVFENNAAVSAGNSNYAVELKSGAWFSFTNNSAISNPGGTAIYSSNTAGDFDLSVNDAGSIKGDVAVNYRASKLFNLVSSGVIEGDISVAADPDNDSVTFAGGSYSGTVTGVEQVRFTGGQTNVSGTFTLNGTGTRYLKVFTGGDLETSGLAVSGGDFIMASGSQLTFDLDDNNKVSSGSSAVAIDASSTTSVDIDDGKLVVYPAASHTSGSETYRLLSVPSSLPSNNVELAVNPLYTIARADAGSEVRVTVGRNSKAPRDVITENGGSQSEGDAYEKGRDAAIGIIQSGGSAQNKAEKLLDNFNSKTTVEGAKRLANELQPNITGSAMDHALNVTTTVNGHVSKRMDNQTQGVNTGDHTRNSSFWIQALHSESKQDDRNKSGNTVRGYNSRVNGFTMGVDTDLSPDFLAGIAFSYGKGDINKNDVEDETGVDTFLTTLYGRWGLGERADLDVMVNYGVNKNDRRRVFDVAGSNLNPATSEFDSTQYGIKAILSRRMMAGKWEVTPMAGYHYTRFTIDAYTEKGSAAALKTEKQKYKVNELGAGVGISRTFNSRYGQFVPEVKVMGWHNLSADPIEVDSRFVIGGDNFVAKGVAPEKTTWNATAGITWNRDERFELSAGYERNWRSGFHSDSVYTRVKYKF